MFNFIKRYWPTALAVLILLTALTGVYAKYVIDQTLEEGKITITAELGTIQLLEHKAIKKADGSYVLQGTDANGQCDGTEHDHLDGSTEKPGNSYVLIPGLDIPKDPYVQITDKTPIEVYVYLIVTEDSITAKNITYQLKDHWKPISDGSKVYVYSDANGAKKVTADTTIPVLQDNTVYVSQDLSDLTGSVTLSFSACMKQYVTDKTAQEIYSGT